MDKVTVADLVEEGEAQTENMFASAEFAMKNGRHVSIMTISTDREISDEIKAFMYNLEIDHG
jgi:hypothetical protein